MRWTPAEDQVLRELVEKGMTLQAIGDHLDESHGAIRGRVQRLGLRSKGLNPAARRKADAKLAAERARLEGARVHSLARQWTAEEDALLASLHAAGEPMWKIGQALHVATTTASMRARVIGLIPPVDYSLPLRTERFTCQHCGTRCVAALNFGCGQCLPLRRAVA